MPWGGDADEQLVKLMEKFGIATQSSRGALEVFEDALRALPEGVALLSQIATANACPFNAVAVERALTEIEAIMRKVADRALAHAGVTETARSAAPLALVRAMVADENFRAQLSTLLSMDTYSRYVPQRNTAEPEPASFQTSAVRSFSSFNWFKRSARSDQRRFRPARFRPAPFQTSAFQTSAVPDQRRSRPAPSRPPHRLSGTNCS